MITVEEVQVAYETTGLKPVSGDVFEVKNGIPVGACAMGVLGFVRGFYTEEDLMSKGLNTLEVEFDTAIFVFGLGFDDGFDGSSIALSKKDYLNGYEIGKAIRAGGNEKVKKVERVEPLKKPSKVVPSTPSKKEKKAPQKV